MLEVLLGYCLPPRDIREKHRHVVLLVGREVHHCPQSVSAFGRYLHTSMPLPPAGTSDGDVRGGRRLETGKEVLEKWRREVALAGGRQYDDNRLARVFRLFREAGDYVHGRAA